MIRGSLISLFEGIERRFLSKMSSPGPAPPKPQKPPRATAYAADGSSSGGLAHPEASVTDNEPSASTTRSEKLLLPTEEAHVDHSAGTGTEDAVTDVDLGSTQTGSKEGAARIGGEDSDVIIKSGQLTKIRYKDGEGAAHSFQLRATSLVYYKKVSTIGIFKANLGSIARRGSLASEDLNLRSIDLSSIRAVPASPEILEQYGEGAFRILGTQRSFVLIAESSEERDEWISAIDAAAVAVQQSSPSGAVLIEKNLLPVRASKAETEQCKICQRPFGFLTRRNHCRNCGACVCDSCSREKVRLPHLGDDRALLKVCSTCAKEVKNTRKYGVTKGDGED